MVITLKTSIKLYIFVVITLKTFTMISRKLYVDQLVKFIDKPLIKVITGVRRSGKSSLLILMKELFVSRGIKPDHIIYINFESFVFSELDNAERFYKYLSTQIDPKEKYYLLLDEIQEVNSWEKAVNSLMVDFDCDIYITGSNSRLLSSDLATYITGRYVEINVYTLSFKESIQFRNQLQRGSAADNYTLFEEFIRLGGFPVLHTSDYDLESAWKVVYDIYSSAILRDTVQRNNIRDVELLERVVKFVFDNVGNRFSSKNVADYFKSQQRKIDLNTVYNYLNALESAFIIYRIPRYDVKGKEILKTQEKYFVGDQAFLHAVSGFRQRNISGMLENIVMLELLRRGYKVYTGKSGDLEIDFIAENNETKIYIQVAYLLTEQSTIDREFNPLLEIKDHYPKFVLSTDRLLTDNIEGVRHLHIADWLLRK